MEYQIRKLQFFLTGQLPGQPIKRYNLKYYRHRIIDKEIMDIKQDLFITVDSIVFWSVKDGDEIAIQITNSEYVAMIKQLFSIVWSKAKVIDRFGNGFK